MQNENQIALKEWAVVCESLVSGQQLLIVRKGGINEKEGEFLPDHNEFWLFATQFHQNAEQLVPEAAPLMARAQNWQPDRSFVCLPGYAVVEEVFHLSHEEKLPALAGLHILSERTIADRFHYRKPGLFVLAVRVYSLLEPLLIPNSPHFEGCRSWVELPATFSTDELLPALDEAAFESELKRIRSLISDQGLV